VRGIEGWWRGHWRHECRVECVADEKYGYPLLVQVMVALPPLILFATRHF
jgi:hypothetical protein